MSGTFLEVGGSASGNGGGGGGSAYWKDAVADFASLPTGTLNGETRITLDTQTIYVWDGASWLSEDAGEVPVSRTISTTAPLAGGGSLATNRTISIPAATTSVDGYLAATDFVTFNNKVGASRSISTTAPITGGGDLSADRTLAMAAATGSVDGYLTSGNFNTFNGKEPAITSGATSEFWRGDKSFQALNSDALSGIVDGSSAAAGKIGQVIEDNGPALSVTGVGATGVWGAAHSKSLAAGDYEVWAVAEISENSSVLTDYFSCAVTSSASPGAVAYQYISQFAGLLSSTGNAVLVTPKIHVSVAAPTTYYANTLMNYSSGTPKHAATIFARRIR